jgi:DNA-binding transcriptional LysR family regulator
LIAAGAMNLRQIEVFRALMLAGSVTGAARLLHVSQPGVSRMLGHIELQLGIKLFERIRGKLHAKPEAEVLFREVEFAYRGVKRIEDCARGLQAGSGLSLRVLATPSLALELVPQAIADTVTRFPAATLYVESQLVREITRQLVSEEADIAISSLPIEHALLQSVAVGHWTVSCAFGASHPFAARRRLSPRDILKERLIAFSSDTPQGRLVADWAAKAGITPTRHIEVRSGQIACALVAAGAGIAVVDSLTARAWSGSNLAFRPIIGAPTFNAHAVRHASSASSLLADAFVGRIRARFGRSPAS